MQDQRLPLSISQREIYLERMINPRSNLHTIGGYIEITGRLDTELFAKALEDVIAVNDVFDIIIHEQDGIPWQEFKKCLYSAPIFDFTSDGKSCKDWMQERFLVPIDMLSQPLFDFVVIKESQERYYWFIKAHHIIIDGWGVSRLVNAVSSKYTSLLSGIPAPHIAAIRYSDSVARDRLYFESHDYRIDAEYWKACIGTSPQPLFSPEVGRRHINPASRHGDRIATSFDVATYRRITRFARKHRTTAFRVIIAALYTLLSRIYSQSDITFGYPILNRENTGERRKIGLYTRLLPLRIEVSPSITFQDLIGNIGVSLQQNEAHRRFSISDIRNLNAAHKTPLDQFFDVVFSFEKHDYGLQFGDSHARALSLSNRSLPCPLSIFFQEFSHTDDVRFVFDYNLDYFNASDIESFICSFQDIIVQCIDSPQSQLREFELTSDAEIKLVDSDFNRVSTPLPRHTQIIKAFEEQACHNPQGLALIDDGYSFSYAELISRASQLAGRILAAVKEPAAKPIGILLERNHNTVIAILAVLRAGGYFVPVDPDYPESRIHYMFEDSEALLIITKREFYELAAGVRDAKLLLIDEELAEPIADITPIHTNSLAYVMYTSGSTGTPKGVLVSQIGVLNMFAAQMAHFQPAPGDRILQFASFSFDASIFELCMALLSGATLVMAPQRTIEDPNEFGAFLITHRITIATLPPSYLHVVPRKKYSYLRIIITAGDAPKLEDVAYYCSHVQYFNAYGPTESSVWTTIKLLQPGDLSGTGYPNIGRPIQNLSIWILDPYRKMLPINYFGELCIGGIGLAEGYLNDTASTHAQFIPNPYLPRKILYRSGDRARWLLDGTLELSGRIDDQLKIRGYRIDPSEIESTLLMHPLIREAVVVGCTSGATEKELVACLVLGEHAGPHPSEADIRRYLQNELPSFMIPAVVCFMDALPLSHNGKVDKLALSEQSVMKPTAAEPLSTRGFKALEKTLMRIWTEVLPTKEMGLHDNFFDLGGNSLHAIQIASKLVPIIGSSISARTILSNLTIFELAIAIENQTDLAFCELQSVDDREAYQMSPVQKQIWVAHELSDRKSLYNVQACYHIFGKLDVSHLKMAINKALKRHDVLRSSFFNMNGELTFRIIDEKEVVFEVQEYDLNGSDDTEISDFIASLDEHVFDLSDAPLVQSSLIGREAEESILVLVLHHLVCDWLSIKILQEEIRQLYCVEISTDDIELPRSSVGYREHAAWQNRAMEDSFEAERYWANMFDECPISLSLPLDYGRPSFPTYAGDLHRETFTAELANNIAEKARQWHTTTYTVLFASLNVLFHKYSGHTDIVLGTVMAGRDRALTENVVGCFMNTLALRTRFLPTDSFASIVETVRQLILEAHEHQNYPLHKIVNMLNMRNNDRKGPLFNVMVDMLFVDVNERLGLSGGADMIPAVYNYRKSKYDLTIYILADPRDITVIYEYSTEIFSSSTIHSFARRWSGLLKELLAESGREIRDVDEGDPARLPVIRRHRRD